MKFARPCTLIFAFLLLGCSRYQVLDALVPRCGYTQSVNITYGPMPREKLDVYQPNNAKPGKSIVIFFYGGYWQFGKKENYRFVGQALTSEGFIAVLPDYRLYPTVTFPAFLQDGALAVKWAHDNAQRLGGDPNHIYLMGHSAGAYIAVMLTVNPQYLDAVGLDRHVIHGTVGLSGPYDFKLGPDLRKVFAQPATGPVDPAVEPITFADGKSPPMLLLQGGRDTVVEPGNATRLAGKIRKLGGQARAIVYGCRDHASVALALAAPFHWLAPVLKDSVDFFREH
jgi:acetyl esterase/lipase